MGFLNKLRGTLSGGDQHASDIQAELDFHIEQRVEDLIAEGHKEVDARRMARLEFGGNAKLREETREADVFITLENGLRDARQSLRGFRQRPVFAATSILSLAIGIGAVAALFAVADAVVWKPIALPNEQELYDLQEAHRGDLRGSNGPRTKDWQALTSIAGATGTYSETLVWRGPEGNEAVHCLRIFTGLNATLKPIIAVGRSFTSEEEAGSEPVALATNAFWRHRLNSESPLGDRTLELSGKVYRIVGVLDASIGYPDGIDLWVPAPTGLQGGTREASYLDTIVRLKPGVTLAQAQAEVNLMAARLAQAYPKTDENLTATLAPFREQLTRGARSSLFILLAIVACVLAMICVNVAALLLARGTERERESALRSALGASPASLIQLYLIEAVLLALVGGALGTAFAFGAVDVLKRILPHEMPRLSDAAVDWRVLCFALGVSLLTALASGLVPAWLATRNTELHDGTRGSSTSVRADRKRLRGAFVIVEIAISVMLVTTGFRLAEAFTELASRPKPFQIENVVTVTVPFPWTVKEERLYSFTARALERFATLPGVTQVGVTDQFPLLGGAQDRDVRVDGVSTAAPIHAGFRLMSTGYFDALGIRLVNGAMFSTRQNQIEFVVNEAFAKHYFTDGRPANAHRLAFGKSEKWYAVTGVVSDVLTDPAHREADPEVFTNYSNDYWPLLNFALRTTAPASLLAPLVREEVSKLDGTVIVKSVAPMKDRLGESTKDSRIRSSLVGGAAAFALLLMAIGIHGLIASDVASRWREFGVRLALGSTVGSIRGLLIRKIALLALLGATMGVGAVAATSQMLDATFAGLPPVHALTITMVIVAIALAAASAILWPLLRIANIDAATALRHE